MCLSTRRYELIGKPGAKSPGSKLPATPAPLKPSSTHSCERSKARRTGAQLQDNRRSAKNDAKCVRKALHRHHEELVEIMSSFNARTALRETARENASGLSSPQRAPLSLSFLWHTQTHKHTNTQTHKHTNTRTHEHTQTQTDTQTQKPTNIRQHRQTNKDNQTNKRLSQIAHRMVVVEDQTMDWSHQVLIQRHDDTGWMDRSASTPESSGNHVGTWEAFDVILPKMRRDELHEDTLVANTRGDEAGHAPKARPEPEDPKLEVGGEAEVDHLLHRRCPPALLPPTLRAPTLRPPPFGPHPSAPPLLRAPPFGAPELGPPTRRAEALCARHVHTSLISKSRFRL